MDDGCDTGHLCIVLRPFVFPSPEMPGFVQCCSLPDNPVAPCPSLPQAISVARCPFCPWLGMTGSSGGRPGWVQTVLPLGHFCGLARFRLRRILWLVARLTLCGETVEPRGAKKAQLCTKSLTTVNFPGLRRPLKLLELPEGEECVKSPVLRLSCS